MRLQLRQPRVQSAKCLPGQLCNWFAQTAHSMRAHSPFCWFYISRFHTCLSAHPLWMGWSFSVFGWCACAMSNDVARIARAQISLLNVDWHGFIPTRLSVPSRAMFAPIGPFATPNNNSVLTHTRTKFWLFSLIYSITVRTVHNPCDSASARAHIIVIFPKREARGFIETTGCVCVCWIVDFMHIIYMHEHNNYCTQTHTHTNNHATDHRPKTIEFHTPRHMCNIYFSAARSRQ